jgi:molybdenum cofactor biosynthesis enzyme MoaA
MHIKEEKFTQKYTTKEGQDRAYIKFTGLKTLWFNTGTLCNLSCEGCYIESSPINNKLLYLDLKDVEKYLEQMKIDNLSCDNIGITGGEPFMNKDIIPILKLCIKEKYNILVLTNAMQPMLNKINELIKFSNYDKLTLRVSLDHYSKKQHEQIRGQNTWDKAIKGIRWLIHNNFKISIASRIINKDEKLVRKGFAKFFKDNNFKIDAYNKTELLLFPEMDLNNDTPEITTDCWDILNNNPKNMMCSNSRMIVKRREDSETHVVSCTLIPFERDFSFGSNLKNSFKNIYLNHPFCSKFCVLGGANCSNN